MNTRQRDPVKIVIWSVFALLLLWSLFFTKSGPQAIVSGIRFGSILMLGAIGLTLTYKILNFANFSHGDILIFGAYVAFSADWFLVSALPGWIPALAGSAQGELVRWLALVTAIVAGGLGAIGIAILIDWLIYSRMRRSGALVLVIASFGMALFLRALIQAIWGVGNRAYAMRTRLPTFYAIGDINGDGSLDVFAGTRSELTNFAGTSDFSGFTMITMTSIQLITVIVAVLLVVLLHLFLKYTKTGKAMRAMSDNMDLARVSGINTERMIGWTWVIGAGLAAVGGVSIGLNFGIITPNTGALVLLPLFAAVILGGIGSPYGAMLGAMVIGIAQNVLVDPVIPSISSAYKPGIAFLLMILMLLVRPEGLLGEAERRG